MLLTGLFEGQKQIPSDVAPKPPMLPGIVRVEAELDATQHEDFLGVLAHSPRQVEQAVPGRVDGPDDVAHRANGFACDAGDRGQWSARYGAPDAGVLPRGYFTEQRDARQVCPDVVMQVGGNSRPHVGHLERASEAVTVYRMR